jgi:hypothetical protein
MRSTRSHIRQLDPATLNHQHRLHAIEFDALVPPLSTNAGSKPDLVTIQDEND